MSDLAGELNEIEARASAIHTKGAAKAVKVAIDTLIAAANEVEAAHSGSWLGYQSCVYYKGLRKPETGAFFDRQWGIQERYSNRTTGEWIKLSYSEVFDYLAATETKPTFDELLELASSFATEVDDLREDLLVIIEACRAASTDEFLDRMMGEANKARMTSAKKFAEAVAIPPPPITNDLTAVAGGTQVPPHVEFKATVCSVRSLFDCAEDLAKIAKRTRSYLSQKLAAKTMFSKTKGTRVFIGHGRSGDWMELKNYIQDRLELHCDDFNRQASAGHTTVARLVTMLDDACFAFLVLTAEDELTDGKLVARQNVIHEAGLFQGRLGFEKAIVMLEEGCDEFSNIHGLIQIRFEQGKIKAAFHEVADTLKREGIASA